MEPVPDIPKVANLLADGGRAAMAWALIDGSSRSAGELARKANLSAQSASRHLSLLLAGGLLEVQPQGRQRFYRIANPEVACMIESMATLSAEVAASPCSAIKRAQPAAFRQARTCYDHFAGRFAVDLLEALLKANWLQRNGQLYELTPQGESGLVRLGVDVSFAKRQQRVFARPCPDLSERSPHLGGALATAILNACVAQGWVLRSRHSRVVSITPAGWSAFEAGGLGLRAWTSELAAGPSNG
jgi:DNA-binding transcriptional ArsR family regulator